ncbi:hypothetical protein C823_005308 [Eubacterium plexicaudatum ASF492]|nr:hypothetical protein C823_005308 [Eubacterium plexicaudatum ASF492]
MLRINKYVEVIDSEKIISIGKYRIGTEIPCGEYYLWGKDIWYSYKRKRKKNIMNTLEKYMIYLKKEMF